VPRETDRLAAHEVDLAVARVAPSFAGVHHEAQTLAAAGQPGREVAAAALARQRYTKQRPNR